MKTKIAIFYLFCGLKFFPLFSAKKSISIPKYTSRASEKNNIILCGYIRAVSPYYIPKYILILIEKYYPYYHLYSKIDEKKAEGAGIKKTFISFYSSYGANKIICLSVDTSKKCDPARGKKIEPHIESYDFKGGIISKINFSKNLFPENLLCLGDFMIVQHFDKTFHIKNIKSQKELTLTEKNENVSHIDMGALFFEKQYLILVKYQPVKNDTTSVSVTLEWWDTNDFRLDKENKVCREMKIPSIKLSDQNISTINKVGDPVFGAEYGLFVCKNKRMWIFNHRIKKEVKSLCESETCFLSEDPLTFSLIAKKIVHRCTERNKFILFDPFTSESVAKNLIWSKEKTPILIHNCHLIPIEGPFFVYVSTEEEKSEIMLCRLDQKEEVKLIKKITVDNKYASGLKLLPSNDTYGRTRYLVYKYNPEKKFIKIF